MNKTLIHVQNLSKSYPIQGPEGAIDLQILRHIEFSAQSGQTVAISGASGEGKSTLLQLIGLLDKPSAGSIQFPHWPGETEDQIRAKHLGFIFQQFYLLEDLSVLDNVLLPLRIHRASYSKEQAQEKALIQIERVGLSSRLHHPASCLSGGEKQRCAIARSLIHDPLILLADEPTGNLDHDNAQQVANLLFEIAQQREGLLILVTHERSLAARADKAFHLDRGHLHVDPCRVIHP